MEKEPGFHGQRGVSWVLGQWTPGRGPRPTVAGPADGDALGGERMRSGRPDRLVVRFFSDLVAFPPGRFRITGR